MRFSWVLLLAVVPQSALACAVCVSNNEESANAFLLATILLTALPLAVILGSIRWAQRCMAAQEREAQIHYEALHPGQGGVPPSSGGPVSRTFPS